MPVYDHGLARKQRRKHKKHKGQKSAERGKREALEALGFPCKESSAQWLFTPNKCFEMEPVSHIEL